MRNKYSQNIAIASGKYNQERDYWLDRLSGDLNITGFPPDYPRIKTDEKMELIQFHFSADVAQRIVKMSKTSEYAVYMFLLAGVTYLLQKYTRSEELLVASPILRTEDDAEYLNHLLVLRTLLTKEMTFKEWMIQIRQTVGEANEHPNYPIYKIIEHLHLPSEEGKFPLADVLVLLENIHGQTDFREEGFDTVFSFLLEDGALTGKLIYNANLFAKATIQQIITYLQRFFEIVTKSPDIKLSAIEILSEEEKQQQLFDWNATQVIYPKEKTVYQLFEEQVEKTPDQIALVFEESQLTYRELNEKANQLARVLRERGVKPDQIIGLMVDRSMEMIVGLLAILKAGGAYLPIDPEYPAERIRYILQDSQVRLLLTQSHFTGRISFAGEHIDLEDQHNYIGERMNLESTNTPNDLAYVIYTSGSTGQPKGVLIAHQGLVNYVTWASKIYLQGAKWNFPLYSSLSFDLTVTSIYLPLITGNQIIIYGHDEKEMLLSKIIKEDQIQIIKLTPAHLQLMKEMDLSKSNIQAFIVGGEELKTELASQVDRKYHGKAKIYNEYGPTETVVGCMVYQYDAETDQGRTVPIGVPADNVQIYLLDEDRRPVATGVPGEIYISGDGVARGYFRQPLLTEERFIENPFIPGQRMYKTGDLARRSADGNIEFMGRLDHQVKIRGYRIELGEIEAQLLQRSDIEEAVVIDYQDELGDKTLCAYLAGQKELAISAIKEDLAKVLPGYMIPTYFIVLDTIPLTPNGKVDRRALPDPSKTGGRTQVAPRNSIEAKLLEIWKKILNKDEIGVTDNFFEIGGHSLKATQLMAHIYKEMNVEFSLMEIFSRSTIETLAEAIREKDESMYLSITPVEEREYYPLSSAQKRLFILNKLNKDTLSYNIPFFAVILSELNTERFEETIHRLVQRHEALRTSFDLINGEPVQKIDQNLDFPIQYHDVSEEELPALVQNFIRPFDLTKAPLLRVELAKYDERYLLMMDMHHIISDGTSMDILFSDFVKLYHGEEPDPLRIQYKDFAVWQNDLLQSERIEKMETYWVEQFAGEIPVLHLPTDFQRPVVKNFAGGYIPFTISKEIADQLSHLAVETGSTIFMVLLAAYHVLLSQYSGQNDLVVGTPIAGRLHADVERVIGMFLNTLPLRNRIREGQTFAQFLEEVKINTLLAYENQEYQFEMLVDKLEIPRTLNRMPLFDVMFVLQNMDESEKDFHELRFVPYEFQNQTAKADLTLFASEAKDLIQFVLNYSTGLFERKTVESMAGRFVEILALLAANPDILLAEMTRPSEKEKSEILTVFRENLVMDEIENGSLQELFYHNVDQNPDKVAIEYGQKSLTYLELDQHSNWIANWLISNGFQQGSHLGILIEDRIQFITLILASLKSGCVFIPLDQAYPSERISAMVQNVNLALIFTDFANAAVAEEIFLQEIKKPEIVLCEPFFEPIQDGMNIERPRIKTHPDDNAYIYFTSGSSGKPKGVLGRYKSLVHFIQWEIKTMQVNADFRTTQFASPGFDALLRDLFVPICAGGTLCIPETRDLILDMNKLVKWIEQSRINLIHCVPSVFRLFNLSPLCSKNFPDLKYILMAGERINPRDVKHWYDIFDERVQLVNLYGPTETTLVKTVYFIQKEDSLKRTIPVGKPMEGARILIADEQLSPCKPGMIGEIYIRTPYMSLGYTDPDLTREKFIQNPYSNLPGDLVYRTGDLGRWMPDGNLEFMGRSDHQVKIHGVRIESGDIENQILHYDSIKEVIVIDREDSGGEPYLIAYFVAAQDVSISDLRKNLLLRLPEYMLPLYYVQMDQFPLNPNGKIDRSALPEPSQMNEKEWIAPRNAVEEKLLEIWQEVLGRKEIGVTANFFEMGGHSLKATRLMAYIAKEMNVELSLMEIFERPTIADLAEIIAVKEESMYSPIEPVEEQEYYPASSAQKRLFVLDQLDTQNLAYNMPFVMVVEAAVDQERLEAVINQMIQRHEILRTSFALIDGVIVQRVHPEVDFTIDCAVAQEDQLDEIIRDFIQPFDLRKAPLLRGKVIRFGDNHVLLMDMHHIISDGISMGIFFNEIIKLLQGEELNDLRIQYKDFTVWQNGLLQSDQLQKQEEYWLDLFADEVPVLDLPTDFPRSAKMSLNGETLRFSTGKERKEELENMAKENGVTLNMLMLAIYTILLSKYTAQEDIIIGTPVAGRNHADLEQLIGLFVNTLAMRNKPESHKTVEEFLQEVRINSLAAYENQNYQFEMLIDKLNLQRDVGRNPLFDTLFDFHTAEQRKRTNPKCRSYDFERKAAKFDLSLECLHTEDDLILAIQYTTDLYKKETIERMANHLIQIMHEVIHHPKIQISAIEMLSSGEKEQLIYGLNNKKTDIPGNTTVHQIIERQAALDPERVALLFHDQRITYRELNEHSNQLARVLRHRGIAQDRLVGILLDRSPFMVESILATWKAGGAYIPIDPAYPEQRIKGILSDSEAALLLTTSEYLHFDCEELGERILQLDTWKTRIQNESTANLELQPDVHSLAYVIYTSGSTGKPKGAMVEHLGMLNHMQAKINDLALDERSIVVQNASHCFDISVWQFFVALVTGGQTVIYPNELTMNPETLIESVIQDEVTILEVVPSFLSVMLDILENRFRNFNTLNYLLVTGEMVKPILVKRWFQLYPEIKMVNAYGPTEASDDITHHIMTEAPNMESISIGRPVDNFHIYIVDNNMNLCPMGVKGEICVSGIGVGRGYVNDPERTKAVFMDDPFVREKGVRLYKTGDLGRWLADGTIEFFGRKDHQVKIRGFRIELGEIESRLVEHPQIKEAVVLNKEDPAGNQYLCAYLVKEEVSVSEIKAYLLESLPNYMVPAFFVELDKMPLNANGKLDRKALPEVAPNRITDTEYVAPENDTEKEMAEIWSEILGVERISVLANFFDLGGHSLNAMQFVSKANQKFKTNLPLKEVFTTPTIRELAAYIMAADQVDYETIKPVEEREYYPASFAQKRFYLLRQLLESGVEYNMSAAWMIEGDLDQKRLETAVHALVERHETLRTSFELKDDMLVQRVHKSMEIEIQWIEANLGEIQTICKEFIKPFDLDQVPLFRVGYVKCGVNSFLLLDMHHIISDGLSTDILIEEFIRLYTGEELPKLRIQYKDFAIWQNEFFKTVQFQKQRAYWLDRFAGETPLLKIPTDQPRELLKDAAGKSLRIVFDEDVTANVNELIASKGVTLYMFLLSVCNILLWKYSGQNDIIIGTPISGRFHTDLEKMIGVFVNTLPMRNYPHGDKGFGEFLDEIKENTLTAYENQDYPFDLLVEELKIKRASDRNPLFDVVLDLQNRRSRNSEEHTVDGLQFKPVGFDVTIVRFDLRFAVAEGVNKIYLRVDYKANLFAEETITNLLKNFSKIIETVVDKREIRLSEIKLESNLQQLEMVSIEEIDFGF